MYINIDIFLVNETLNFIRDFIYRSSYVYLDSKNLKK